MSFYVVQRYENSAEYNSLCFFTLSVKNAGTWSGAHPRLLPLRKNQAQMLATPSLPITPSAPESAAPSLASARAAPGIPEKAQPKYENSECSENSPSPFRASGASAIAH